MPRGTVRHVLEGAPPAPNPGSDDPDLTYDFRAASAYFLDVRKPSEHPCCLLFYEFRVGGYRVELQESALEMLVTVYSENGPSDWTNGIDAAQLMALLRRVLRLRAVGETTEYDKRFRFPAHLALGTVFSNVVNDPFRDDKDSYWGDNWRDFIVGFVTKGAVSIFVLTYKPLPLEAATSGPMNGGDREWLRKRLYDADGKTRLFEKITGKKLPPRPKGHEKTVDDDI